MTGAVIGMAVCIAVLLVWVALLMAAVVYLLLRRE